MNAEAVFKTVIFIITGFCVFHPGRDGFAVKLRELFFLLVGTLSPWYQRFHPLESCSWILGVCKTPFWLS